MIKLYYILGEIHHLNKIHLKYFNHLWLEILALICLSACGDSVYEPNNSSITHAIVKARDFMERTSCLSRKAAYVDAEVQPIMGGAALSRSHLSDTIAYVVNFLKDNAFVIVSSKEKGDEVLAYSDDNTFSLENEIAKCQFIACITGAARWENTYDARR